ncbi:MAG: hypothetical protein H0U71_02850 [Gammaproteobacteria bacterium]|nr:hypothetical protein [Gammaproteobacteria bacterium]
MPKEYDSLDEFAKLIWGKRAEGLPVPELDFQREITPQELENIHQKYAFVQILNPEAADDDFADIKIIRSSSGWSILNYKNAMSASPGEMLFYQGDYIQNDAAILERVCSGRGTIILQIMNTGADMVRIAKEENWPAIHIVNGHPFMSWAVWKAAQDLHLPVTGYQPSKYEEAKYQRIQRECPTLIIHEPKAAKP